MISGYNGNSSLKRTGTDFAYTEDQVLEIAKCVEDPIYFIDNYCYIVTLDLGIQPFKLYECQKEKVELIHNNRKVLIMEGRQQGKCVNKMTKYKVRNKSTGETLYVSAEEFHEMQALPQSV